MHTIGTLDFLERRVEDIERQQRYEAYAVERGVRRYRDALTAQGEADSDPGMEAARDALLGSANHKGLIRAIAEIQEEAKAGIADSAVRNKQPWWWFIGHVPADSLAYITVRAIINAPARTRTGLASNIGASVRQEVEFLQWKQDEAKRTKAAKEAGEKYTNVYQDLVSKAKGKVDAKTFKRWKAKLDTIRKQDWKDEDRIRLGAVLLDAAVKHGGGWFQDEVVRIRGRTERRVGLTALGRAALDMAHEKLELARPLLVPMKCPPKPWVRKETTV